MLLMIPEKEKNLKQGKLSLEDLRNYAIENGEPETKSGKTGIF